MPGALRQLGMSQEAEDVQAVIESDHHNTFTSHTRAVIARLGTIAVSEAAAVDVDEYGQLFLLRFGGCPYVQVQAALAHSVAAEPVVGGGIGHLHAAGT